MAGHCHGAEGRPGAGDPVLLSDLQRKVEPKLEAKQHKHHMMQSSPAPCSALPSDSHCRRTQGKSFLTWSCCRASPWHGLQWCPTCLSSCLWDVTSGRGDGTPNPALLLGSRAGGLETEHECLCIWKNISCANCWLRMPEYPAVKELEDDDVQQRGEKEQNLRELR